MYRITLIRKGEVEKELGTVPNVEAMDQWFEVAYSLSLLPDPPRYTDELRVYEVPDICDMDIAPELRWVWRLSWHKFEVAQ
jgi:hypothetical protein